MRSTQGREQRLDRVWRWFSTTTVSGGRGGWSDSGQWLVPSAIDLPYISEICVILTVYYVIDLLYTCIIMFMYISVHGMCKNACICVSIHTCTVGAARECGQLQAW